MENSTLEQSTISNKIRNNGELKEIKPKSLSISRQRWHLLSEAVRLKQFKLQDLSIFYEKTSSPTKKSVNPLSIIIESFGLINYRYQSNEKVWITCNWNKELNLQDLNLDIKLVHDRLHVKDLVGFDNSGNVRVWSSEEALGYLLSNGILRSKLEGRIICELGAGMTALAALIFARLDLHHQLYLTDGNERCVRNIQEIVQRNFSCKYQIKLSSENELIMLNKIKNKSIIVKKLCWNQLDSYENMKNIIEVIICSDCLFCTDQHQHLINTIDYLLVLDETLAQAIIISPKRGDKLEKFISLVLSDGRFLLKIYDYFEFSKIFDQLNQIDSNRSIAGTCYPNLLVMKRRPKTLDSD